MIFGEKTVIGPEKCFTCNDLYLYLEEMLKTATQRNNKIDRGSNYAWLKAREVSDLSMAHHLQDLRPLINKMSSEDCVTIAVKLDNLTEELSLPTSDLLTLIKQLLLEQDSTRLMEKSIRGVKEKGYGRKVNKVHPELNGRQATVSFIVETEL